jgi:hypothetical protein
MVVVVVVVFSLEPKLWFAAYSPDACRREKREEEIEVRDLFVQEQKTRGGGGILSTGTDLLGR